MWLKFYFICGHLTKVCLFAFLWEKLKKPQFCKAFTRKTTFSEGWCWFEFNNLGLAQDMTLEFYIRVTKLVKLKAEGHKVSGAISYICEVVRGKVVKGRERGGGRLQMSWPRCSIKHVFWCNSSVKNWSCIQTWHYKSTIPRCLLKCVNTLM